MPPGPAIAVLAGAGFALAAASRMLVRGRRRGLAAAALLLLLLASAGCGSSGSGHGRLKVVATTTQIGDWARIVGGGDVDVHQILQPNTDPHEYEPRPKDVIETAGARVVFENGDNLDRWVAKIVSNAGGHPTVVDLGSLVPVRLAGETTGPEASRFDPHWWHDPVNAAAAVREIGVALARADPAHAARCTAATPPGTRPGSVRSTAASPPASPACPRPSASS